MLRTTSLQDGSRSRGAGHNRFPTRWLTGALAITFGLCAWLGWNSYRSHQLSLPSALLATAVTSGAWLLVVRRLGQWRSAHAERTEGGLVESEKRYRRLFESAKDGILILDAETGMVVDVNPFLTELLGFSHAEFCARKVWELGFFKDIVDNAEKFFELQQKGYVRYDDLALKTADGRPIEVEFVSNVYRVDSHEVIQCNIRDISERKRAERAAHASLQLLEGIIHALPVRVFWKDRDLVYLGCNAAFARDAGFADPKDVVGKDDSQMAWRDRADLYRRDDRQVIESGDAKLLIEEPSTTPEGNTITLLTSKVPLRRSTDDVDGVIGTYMDITTQKQAEQSRARLAMAVEQAAEAVMITDREGTIVYVNPAFSRITGYSAEESLGRNPRMLKSGKQGAEVYREMWRALVAGEVWRGHLINRRKDGTLYEEDTSISPVRDGAGAVVSFVAVKRDVTREAQLERHLRQSQKMEALGQMASGIAHDFNNSLSPILGFSEMLLRDPMKLADPAVVARYAGIIHTSSLDAASVVRRMLEFGRRRDPDEKSAPLDVAALAHQTVELTRPRWRDQALAQGQDIRIETDLRPVPPINGDESSLRELLTNLVFNAVDALPAGGTIRLQTAREGDDVALRVSDTGTGMTEEVRRRCMEPFYSTKGDRGSGLGLAMVYGTVQRHGGRVEIESAPHGGTVFTIRIPIPSVAAVRSLAPATSMPTEPLHLLMVDDEYLVREVLAEFLMDDGHSIETAADGDEGLAKFKAGRFDAVITDRSMCGMNGEQLAMAIHDLVPSMPVILLTGFGDLMKAAGERPPGVSYILGKPFTQAALRDALARVLPARHEEVGVEIDRRAELVEEDAL